MMITSTTAPGKTFSTRADLAEHYKSDWHKYNLKRREAGLPLLEEADFQARWEAALALRKEKELSSRSKGKDHIKVKTTTTSKKTTTGNLKTIVVVEKNKNKKKEADKNDKKDHALDAVVNNSATNPSSFTKVPCALAESQDDPVIDPKQSLFDSHVSNTLEENVKYMHENFGFFIPDRECLVDLEGLLGYCHEKIKLGHYCLYCEKMFPTWKGSQQHMIHKQHAKLRYEQGYWEELDPFYDFKREDAIFLASTTSNDTKSEGAEASQQQQQQGEDVAMDIDNENEEDGWEDVSENEDGDDEEVFHGYEREIARFGLDVTPLGELVFPDGRIVGHRALRKYYKQRLRPEASSTAIIAARQAAGERLYEGRVVNIGLPSTLDKTKGAGKGILVPLKDGGEGFSALSLYRYRAAIRKQRRDDVKGQRLEHRTTLNINRMDKKANRLMNGVCVQKAMR